MILKIIKIVIIIFILISTPIILIKLNLDRSFILSRFKKGNVIVFGAKGKGKDLLFQRVIIWRYKRKSKKNDNLYRANIDYGYSGKIEGIKTLSCYPNTFRNFINGNIQKIDKIKENEGLDYFLSDGGIYLPCQYDFELDKMYPSFPIYYALSRHLYAMNVHINTQALNRVWIKMREQADSYFLCLGKIKIFGLMICKVRYYELYQTAEKRLKKVKNRTLNKYSKSETDIYNATNGEIRNCYYLLKCKNIKYDTRVFEKILFN